MELMTDAAVLAQAECLARQGVRGGEWSYEYEASGQAGKHPVKEGSDRGRRGKHVQLAMTHQTEQSLCSLSERTPRQTDRHSATAWENESKHGLFTVLVDRMLNVCLLLLGLLLLSLLLHYNRFTTLCPGLYQVSRYQKDKPFWILLKQR